MTLSSSYSRGVSSTGVPPTVTRRAPTSMAIGPRRDDPPGSAAGPPARRRTAPIRARSSSMPERLRDVVVGAGLERRDLVPLVGRGPTGSRIGVVASRRTWRTTALPSRSGRPRSSRMRSGRSASQRRSASATSRALGRRGTRAPRGSRATASRVAASSSTRRMRAGGRAHRSGPTGACRSRTVTARPPSELREAATSPRHRVDETAHDAQADAQPSPRALARQGTATEPIEQRRQRLVGHARTAVLDDEPHRVVAICRGARSPRRHPAGVWRRCCRAGWSRPRRAGRRRRGPAGGRPGHRS